MIAVCRYISLDFATKRSNNFIAITLHHMYSKKLSNKIRIYLFKNSNFIHLNRNLQNIYIFAQKMILKDKIPTGLSQENMYINNKGDI